jgi:hypothetical protein
MDEFWDFERQRGLQCTGVDYPKNIQRTTFVRMRLQYCTYAQYGSVRTIAVI